MSSFESRRFWMSIVVGVVLTICAWAANQTGLLDSLDDFFYDSRAQYCQLFAVKPDNRIVHLDIDDGSVSDGAIGRWPWPRKTLARILDEVARAQPLAVGLDLMFSEKSSPEDDAALARSLSGLKNLVLAAELEVPAANDYWQFPEAEAARKVLGSNLELTAEELKSRLRLAGMGIGARVSLQDLWIHARQLAMRDRVTAELNAQPATDEELIRRLLPNTDLDFESPATHVLKHEAQEFRQRQTFRRFGFPAPELPVAPVPVRLSNIPIPEFIPSVALSGFYNHTFFNTKVVRSLPFLVEADRRLYPQFGFAFGCAMLGADIQNVKANASSITITPPHGPIRVIPTHSVPSESQGRDVSLIADIPFFGTDDYYTMYDWPSHIRSLNHLSMNAVWEICTTLDKIHNSNLSFDRALLDLFATEGNFTIDPDFWKKYSAHLPDADDTASREKVAVEALTKVTDTGMIDRLQAIAARDRTQPQQDALDQLLLDEKILRVGERNRILNEQLDTLRKNLLSQLAGKGVLIGYTAEGLTDRANTSIHRNCPGVIIHGVIAESVLSGRWAYRVPGWVGLAFLFPLGFLTSYCVAGLDPLKALLATLLLLFGYLFFNGYVLYDYGKWIVPAAGPVVAISLVWSGCTLHRVIFEGFERNRVATEVAIISREMDLAHKVQAALIPKTAPVIPGLEANGWTLPASVTGGDCYDLWALPDGRLAILLADASGHGLAPAMIVSQVRTLLRALSDVELHPCDLLRRVNVRVAEDLEPGRFITAFLGFLSADGLLEYAAAGHGPQFCCAADSSELQMLDSTGAPLGCDNEWLCDDPQPPIQIPPGGSLVIFSDGIFEAMTPTHEQFGLDRLTEILKATRCQSGKSIIDQITAELEIWQQNQPPADDQTIVVARRVPVPVAKHTTPESAAETELQEA